MNVTTLAVGLGPFVVMIVAAAILLRRSGGRDRMTEWAESRGLELTSENRPMVAWYLRNARSLRTLGALGGVVLPPLIAAALGLRIGGLPASWVWVFAGYLVGSLYAEARLVRPPTASRTASLATRRLDDYLPARRLRLQRGLGVAGVVLAGLAVAAPGPGDPFAFQPAVAPAVAAALAAAPLAVLLEMLQRWVVRRPQPLNRSSLVAADDAIRSQSVHSVLGSGLAMQLLLVTPAMWVLATSDVQLLRWTMWLPAMLSWIAAVYACLWFGHRAWAVRRPLLPTASAT